MNSRTLKSYVLRVDAYKKRGKMKERIQELQKGISMCNPYLLK